MSFDASRARLIRTDVEQLTADSRIKGIKEAAANYFAVSLCHVADFKDHPGDLNRHLLGAQELFFYRFSQIVPIRFDVASPQAEDRLRTIDPRSSLLMIISNHLPFEKTASPEVANYDNVLAQMGRVDVADKFRPTHLPAVISRRGVFASIMTQFYSDHNLSYHVIGGEFGFPLSEIQKNDGSIIVPYGKNQAGGFQLLYHGMKHVAQLHAQANKDHFPMIVGFPEGGNPQTIENLKDFHSGIFAAASQLAAEGVDIRILPFVMAVDRDFAVNTMLLDPIAVPPGLAGREDSHQFASAIRANMQEVYTQMLESMGDYFWKGMIYPYGGVTRSQIVAMNSNV